MGKMFRYGYPKGSIQSASWDSDQKLLGARGYENQSDH